MAWIDSFRWQAWGSARTAAAPLTPGALNFGVAGIFALAAGIVWYAVSSSPGWISKLAR